MPHASHSASAFDRIVERCPLIPVLVVEDEAQAVPLARALVAGGIAAREITLRSAAALDAIQRIAAAVPEAIVGAGTVLDAAQFPAARSAGARFIVSRGATDAIYDAAHGAGLPYLPAIATAGEIMHGVERGYRRFKFFPAVRAGGIGAESFGEYLALPNVFAVGGSWLAPADKVTARDWSAITALAGWAVGEAKAVRQRRA